MDGFAHDFPQAEDSGSSGVSVSSGWSVADGEGAGGGGHEGMRGGEDRVGHVLGRVEAQEVGAEAIEAVRRIAEHKEFGLAQ